MKLYCHKCDKIFSADNSAEASPCPVCGQVVRHPEKFPGPGTVIGDFLIEKSLSSGGMGEVFVARQISLDRPVALKVLQGEHTNDREYVDGLFREARAAAKINHPNIVQAYAVGEDGGVFFFAMELVRGDTLKTILKREGVLPFDKAAKIICDIAKALDTAWREQKLVHQDIKPDNIMWDNSSKIAKLADLGLAKTATMDAGDDDADEVFGTPQYISPEQLTGIPTDVRSDIYSLGATFFHFVTGRFPYVAPTAEELAHMHNAGNLEPPQKFNSKVPDELNRIILKMMARQIADRYQSPEELIRDLETFFTNFKPDVPAADSKRVPKLAVPGRKAAFVKKKSVPSAVPESPGITASLKNVESEKADDSVAKERKKLEITIPPAVWKISGIIIAAIAVCAGLFVAGLYAAGKFGKLPEQLVPVAEKIFGKFPTEKVEPAEKKAEKIIEQPMAEPVSPVRDEFKSAVDKITAGNFELKTFDLSWQTLSMPQNGEEEALLKELLSRFSAPDEVRCAESRESLRQKFLQAKESEREKRIAASREQERIQRENILRQREIEKLRREEEQRRREHLNTMKKQLSASVQNCIPKMLAAASDPSAEKDFKDTLVKSKLYIESFFGTSEDEVRIKRELSDILEKMPAELAKLRNELTKIASVNSSHYIQFRDAKRELWEVASIKPGALYCRNNSGNYAKMDFYSLDKNSQRTLLRNLKRIMQINNPEFYLDIYNAKTPRSSDAPKGFWKKCFSLM